MNGDKHHTAKEEEKRWSRKTTFTSVFFLLGSGSTKLSAVRYAARAHLAPLGIEGRQAGGQLTITTVAENYLRFPKGSMGSMTLVSCLAKSHK